MQAYDVYLNGVGYMVAKDEAGRFLSGAITEQKSDPFTRYASEEERWKVANLRFSEGAGALKYDGTKRYALGENVDSRSGDLMRGPAVTYTAKRSQALACHHRSGDEDAISDIEISTAAGDWDGFAVRFTTNAPDNEIRSVGILVKRKAGVDYDAAGNFTVELRVDAAGDPGALVAGGQATVSLRASEQTWLPHENLYHGGEYFWMEVEFPGAPTPVLIAATGTYWLCVMNATALPIVWGEPPTASGLTTKTWNGAAWATATEESPYHIVRYADDVDGFTRAFATFRGSDNVRRLYAAVGAKVMYWHEANEEWTISKGDFAAVVHDLIDYDGDMYAAVGDGNDIYYTTGATAQSVWSNIAGQEAQCFALHDNLLWKADVATIKGTIDGHGAGVWAGNTCDVGDAGIPISKMISHGGKLFCAKPEGIFEISYPDGYPAGGTPTANMIHDFRSDRYGRNFILDWHSGCYFPGPGGVYEWKNGVLQDVFRQRFTQDADGTPLLPTYTDRKGEFRAAAGATRGMALGSYSAHCGASGQTFPDGSHLHWFEGRYFHSLYYSSWLGEPIHAVFIESRGEGWSRLWWGQGFDILYMDWPTWSDDRSADDRCEFWREGPDTGDNTAVWMPIIDDDRPDQLKDWHAVLLHSKNMGAGATEGGVVTVKYSIDEAAFVTLGTISSSAAGSTILYFPANTVGYRLQVKLEASTTGGDAYTFRLYACEIRYQPLPDTITQFHVTIRCADNLDLRGRKGGKCPRTGAAMAADLAALLEEQEPWVFTDELGTDHCVRSVGSTKQGAKVEDVPSAQTAAGRLEASVTVSMLEVSDACPS
jgi:hypothetical protein